MHDLFALCDSARAERRKLLSIYLTAGFPDARWTVPLARAIFDSGADMIELGVPYSDPIADGPTIQHASKVALDAGMKLDHLFELAAEVAQRGPTLLMGYFNSVLGRAPERFLDEAQRSGICGLIIPDLLYDAEPDFRAMSQSHLLPIIPFLAPTSTAERMEQLRQDNSPFVYAVSITGVTGTRTGVAQETVSYIRNASRIIGRPVLAGFGVSNSASARELCQAADGVIVGSAVVKRIQDARNAEDAVNRVSAFVSELRQAI